MAYGIDLSKYQKAQTLKQRAAAGEVAIPRIDPTDAASVARLTPEQLALVTTGLYTDARTTPEDTDDTPAVIPSWWSPDKLREVQAQFPDNWKEVARSIASNA